MIATLKIRMPDGSVDTVSAIKGTDGYTPKKGVDYWTEDEKAEFINEILATLPNGDEVEY